MKFNDLDPGDILTWIIKAIKEANYPVSRISIEAGQF